MRFCQWTVALSGPACVPARVLSQLIYQGLGTWSSPYAGRRLMTRVTPDSF